MRRKITIETLQEYARHKEGICLSKKYVNPKVPIKWQCSEGHRWNSPWKSMYDDRWCKECYVESKRLGLRSAIKIATEKEGKCLSTKYKNWKTKLRWKCKMGHEWEACLDNIKNKNQWCPKCAIGASKLSIKDCKRAAVKFGGKCLSSDYKNAQGIMLWQCSSGHLWNAPVKRILYDNKWCPRCRDKSQNVLATNIKRIFGNNITVKQKYRGFEWLNTSNGGRQEIDIFVPELRLAVEYDGQGHFYPVNFGGCDDYTASEIFKRTKRLDKLKDMKIKQNQEDIRYFIRFSYEDNIYNIREVRQKLISYGISVREI